MFSALPYAALAVRLDLSISLPIAAITSLFAKLFLSLPSNLDLLCALGDLCVPHCQVACKLSHVGVHLADTDVTWLRLAAALGRKRRHAARHCHPVSAAFRKSRAGRTCMKYILCVPKLGVAPQKRAQIRAGRTIPGTKIARTTEQVYKVG